MTTSVLVVDDDPRVVKVLSRAFGREGYKVVTSLGGDEALRLLEKESFDVVVLDVNLPPPNGFEVCRRLRDRDDWVPILLLTARDAVDDRVQGLDAGADDYLQKPFSIAELNARVRSLVRRAGKEPPKVLRSNGIMLEVDARRVTKDGREIYLTPREFDLLEMLMSNQGRVLTRSEILRSVWDLPGNDASNVVDVYVRYLREKLDLQKGPVSIVTVRGVGYRWSVEAGSEQAS